MVELTRSSGNPIMIRPESVDVVFQSDYCEVDNETIIRMRDGRGFRVKGSYEEIRQKLGFDHE